MRVLYLSDPLPANTTSGALILHRHLRRLSGHAEVAIAHPEEPALPITYFPLALRPLARLLARLRRGSRHLAALDVMLGWRFAAGPIDRIIRSWKPALILTVAQGGLCHNARRAARRHQLPLVTIFHDWSPDWREHPERFRPALDRAFYRMHAESRLSLCISPEMKAALGPAGESRVLYPIPGDIAWDTTPRIASDAPLTYAGILHGLYQDDILRLAAYLQRHPAPGVPLAFYGPPPHWGDRIGRSFIESPVYRGFLEADEFRRRLAISRALLVIMPFAPQHRRFAELSFPSKLTEYTAVGRPIVVWSPAYSSAANWARTSNAALLVTDPDPGALFTAVQSLWADPAAQTHLAEKAQFEFTSRFSPAVLQQHFEDMLRDSLVPRAA